MLAPPCCILSCYLSSPRGPRILHAELLAPILARQHHTSAQGLTLLFSQVPSNDHSLRLRGAGPHSAALLEGVSSCACEGCGSTARGGLGDACSTCRELAAVQACLDERMVRLLRGDEPETRVILLVGCYSERLPLEIAGLAAPTGVVVISSDYREAEGRTPRMHTVGDVRAFLYNRWWRAVVGFPPCLNTALSGRAEHWWKIASHLQWHGLQFYGFLWCAPADAVMLEHSRSIVTDLLPLPSQTLDPFMVEGGGIERKHTVLAMRGCQHLVTLPEVAWPAADAATGLRGVCLVSHVHEADAEARERVRARTRLGMAVAIAASVVGSYPRLAAVDIPCYDELIRGVAGRWTALGHPLPPEWADPLARRVGGDEARLLIHAASRQRLLTKPGRKRANMASVGCAHGMVPAPFSPAWYDDLCMPRLQRVCRRSDCVGAAWAGITGVAELVRANLLLEGLAAPPDSPSVLRLAWQPIAEALSVPAGAFIAPGELTGQRKRRLDSLAACAMPVVARAEAEPFPALGRGVRIETAAPAVAPLMRRWASGSGGLPTQAPPRAVAPPLVVPGGMQVGSFGALRSPPARIPGVLDVEADRKSAGGNPFVMRKGAPSSARDAACDCFATMLRKLRADGAWAQCAGRERLEAESMDECVHRQLSALAAEVCGRAGIPALRVDPHFATHGARLRLLAWLRERVQASLHGHAQRLLCHCAPERCHCASSCLWVQQECEGRGVPLQLQDTLPAKPAASMLSSAWALQAEALHRRARPCAPTAAPPVRVVVVPLAFEGRAVLLSSARLPLEFTVEAAARPSATRALAATAALHKLKAWLPGDRLVTTYTMGILGDSLLVLAPTSIDAATEGASGGAAWHDVASLPKADSNVTRRAVAAAQVRLEQLLRPAAGQAEGIDAPIVGVGGEVPVMAAPRAFEDRPFEAQVGVCERELGRLRERLLQQAPLESAHVRECMESWAGQVVPPPLGEFTEEMRQLPQGMPREELDLRPFVHRATVPRTHPLPEVAMQVPPPCGFAPTCLEDVLTPTAIRSIRRALKEMQTWHRKRLAGCEAKRPEPLALGATAFQPRARGYVWDLRPVESGGVPVLLDYSSLHFESHLKLPFLAELLKDCPDEELVGMVIGGVRIKAELAAQIVILPNLLSLYTDVGVHAVADELAELENRCWYSSSTFIPFAPWRASPRGAVPRPNGGPPRGIGDLGGPRPKALPGVDLAAPRPEGVITLEPGILTWPEREPVVSVNMATGCGRKQLAAAAALWGVRPTPTWDPELKPAFEDVCSNGCVLQLLANLMGTVVFTLAFDFKYFFHQLFFHPSCWWQLGAVMPEQAEVDGVKGGASQDMRCFTEHVMTMGLSPSSQIAQRLANALMLVFYQKLDAAIEAAELSVEPEAALLLDARAALPHDAFGTQARMFSAVQFTDDPAIQVVGVERMVLAIRVWHEMLGPDGCNFMYAKMAKWQLSVGVVWCGAGIAPSLGAVWIPKAKSMRAAASIDEAARGELSAESYRQLLGFIEHLRVPLGIPRRVATWLWEPLRGTGGVLAESDHVMVSARVRGYLELCRSALLNRPGASILSVIKRLPALPCVTRWRPQSDAAVGDVAPDGRAGLGGYLYGFYWSLSTMAPITIPMAEFLACVLNVIIFEPMLRGARCVVLEVDALATPCVLKAEVARAVGMGVILDAMLACPPVRRLMPTLFVRQAFGENNTAADAASRGKWAVLEELAAALGHRLVHVELPQSALDLIDGIFQTMGWGNHVEPPNLAFEPPPPGERRRFDAARPAPCDVLCARCAKVLLPVHRGLGVCPSCVDYDGATSSAFEAQACAVAKLGQRERAAELRALAGKERAADSLKAVPLYQLSVDGVPTLCYRYDPRVGRHAEAARVEAMWLSSRNSRSIKFERNAVAHGPSIGIFAAGRKEIAFEDMAALPLRGRLVSGRLRDVDTESMFEAQASEAWHRPASDQRLGYEVCSLTGPLAMVNAACARCANVLFFMDSAREVRAEALGDIERGTQLCAQYPLGFAGAVCVSCPQELPEEHGGMGRVHAGPVPRGYERYEREARSYYLPVIDVPADSPTDEAAIRQYVADVGGEVWKTPAPRVDFCARCHKLLDVHHGLGVCPCCVDYDGASPPAPAGLACSSTPLMLRADFRTRCISVSSPLLLPAEPQWGAWSAGKLEARERSTPDVGAPEAWWAPTHSSPAAAAVVAHAHAHAAKAGEASWPGGCTPQAEPADLCSPRPASSPPERARAPDSAQASGLHASPPPPVSPMWAAGNRPSLEVPPPEDRPEWEYAGCEDTVAAMRAETLACAEWSMAHAEATFKLARNAKRHRPTAPLQRQAQESMAQRLLGALQGDTSKYALNPDNPDTLTMACERLASLLMNHVPETTRANEASNWKHWVTFCAHMRTSPWRDDAVANSGGEGHEREVELLALGLLYIYARMKPAKRSPGKPPKPESALAVLRGIRRMHKRMGFNMAGLGLATRLAAALADDYCLEIGPENLAAQRTEPLSNEMVDWLVNMPDGADLGDGRHHDAAALRSVSIRACYATMARTGFRASEVAMRYAGSHTLKRLSRWHLRWRIDGVMVYNPTSAQLRGLKTGDYAILIPPTSKADQFGLEWGPNPIWLRVDVTEGVNAALALAQLELAYPVAPLERRATPLFVDGSKQGLTIDALRTDFKRKLKARFASQLTGTVTLHSFRVYLACCLLALKRSHDEIKALLRWKSDEALAVYARLNASDYADLLVGVGSVTIDSSRSHNLPVQIDVDARASAIVGGRAQLERAGMRADERAAEGDDDADVEPAEEQDGES